MARRPCSMLESQSVPRCQADGEQRQSVLYKYCNGMILILIVKIAHSMIAVYVRCSSFVVCEFPSLSLSLSSQESRVASRDSKRVEKS